MHVFRPAALGVALMAAVGMANAAPDVPTADARGVAISEAAYPGTIVLEVDATEVRLALFAMGQSALRLRWDGTELHDSSQPVASFCGLHGVFPVDGSRWRTA